jgi:hypothetical protein
VTGRNAPPRAARAGMGAATATLGGFAMPAGFMPANYNWDPGMPDYSDPDGVWLATVASGFATLLPHFEG